jgi:homoserine dehydrogenase
MVPAANPVHHVAGVFNGILVDANMLGRALFYGAGAGKLPTASAVVADILNIATGAARSTRLHWSVGCENDMADVADRVCRRCFVMEGCAKCAEKTKEFFGYDSYTVNGENSTFAFISRPMNDREADAAVTACKKTLCWTMPVLD